MSIPDRRLGIVRVHLPDGRSVPLQFTYARIDERGHGWVSDQFKAVAKGGAGSSAAMAALLDVASGGQIEADGFLAAPMATYPLQPVANGLWEAWSLAKNGPDKEVAEDGEAPLSRLRILWAMLTGSRSATKSPTRCSGA